MVVLAASIISKSGKALASRQFLDMPRTKIEGYLAAFPRLVETGKQHTYIETENVRYIYQRIEALYLVLITNKQSNVLEDLETLRLLSKLVRGYSPSLDEEGISQAAFELIFAFDEVISFGHKENVTVAQVKLYCDMESQEEKLHKKLKEIKINETKDLMKRKTIEISKRKVEENRRNKGGLGPLTGSRSSENNMSVSIRSGSGFRLTSDADSISSRSKDPSPASATTPPTVRGMQLGKSRRANQLLESLIAEGEVMPEDVPKTSQTRVPLPPIDPVTVTVEERLNVVTKRDGGVNTFDIQGTLSYKTLNQKDGFIQFQIENSVIPGLNFLTHPQINKDLFKSERIINMKDPRKPFPTGPNDVGLMKWTIQGMDEGSLPLFVNCWPSVSGAETSVNIEYEASDKFDLCNVAISVPLPAVREPPSVSQIDGEWRYDPKSSRLDWSILLIDDSNRSGSMEFVVPSSDPSAFFPITVKFTATRTFSGVRVTSVKPLRHEAPLKFSQTIQLIVNNYQVV